MLKLNYGRLSLTSYVGNSRWNCQCDCGTAVRVSEDKLKSGHTKSCGCLISDVLRERNTTHGKRHTPEYRTWAGIIRRCTNPHDASFHRYGAMGITVCDEWRNSFSLFLDHMGEKPSLIHSIDRIRNEIGYIPGNCRWATPEQQSRNRACIKLYDFGGSKITLPEIAERVGIPVAEIRKRLWRKWDFQRAISQPMRARFPRISRAEKSVVNQSNHV